MKRHLNLQNRRITSNYSERLCLSLIATLSKRAASYLPIVKPETLLEWQRKFIKKRWSFKHKKRGRKPVSAKIRTLILEMKTDNPLWECRRISDELKKLDIDIHHTTVNKMIQTFRREGKIQPTGSWKKFLKSNWDSLFGMDFILNGTIRREALDHFLLFSEKQIGKIVKEYVEYYNHQRPHQGINKIPNRELNQTSGIIKKEGILGGLHHHYYRSSA